ncbi:putative phospholipase B-like 2 isoform X5 [Calonectris borealis]|uniref:putative phospholipase B-like 2 isoform X5 n=1 Tax=Calonectris borealis TaxID=1323832 RepID=UPI003F4B3164
MAALRALLGAALAAALAGAAPAPPPRNVSVLLEPGSGRLRVLPGRRSAAVAWASLDDRIPAVGWAFLEVATNASYSDSLQAYAAGLAEAAVSEQLMYMHWMNTVVGYCGPFKYESEYCEKLRSYLEANLGWMEEQMGKGEDPEYWHQPAAVGGRPGGPGICPEPLLPTARPGLGLLLCPPQAVAGPSGSPGRPRHLDLLPVHAAHHQEAILRSLGASRCFPPTPAPSSPGMTSTSSAAGCNPARWKYLDPRGSVLEWLRNIVANRLARSGPEWAAVFRRFNSGTYNNQWMVVDYNAFTPGRASPPQGVLTVLEQIPGLVVVADQTELLYQQGYWASYNLPYFEEIFNASGIPELVKKYGDWFTYDKNPRAQIFRRNQTLVRDLDSMVRLMRSNNYLRDPLSRCRGCDPPQNAENAISARSDLNPANGTYPFPALRQRCHGGTDMKVTSSGMAPTFGLVAASGPAWDDVPPFRWSASPCSTLLHMGHPDLWTFPPIKVRWD